ncbi:MAG: nitrophenyl compound nitroreductase subunit ArsF family protein [Muribaculaceae bacterium]|jgi:hypothetical protein|nr:nitrophenyl compound nitroreductase subunit ArsF family protein [Muribaculaceae bacterium]
MRRTIIIAILAIFCFAGISAAQNKRVQKRLSSPTRVEVMYFHGKQRCPTCIAIGKYSQEVLNSFFAAQVKKGQVKFREIDISTPEGEKIADSYHVTWSSLYVTQLKNGKEIHNDMTSFGFQYARSNTQAFKNGLRNKITQLLK